MQNNESAPNTGSDSGGAGATSGESSGPEIQGQDLQRYWKTNVLYLVILLSVWAAVSLGAGIVFVEPLNSIKIGGAPLGFWFAQQGSIYTFVGLIVVYIILMNKLDRQYGVYES